MSFISIIVPIFHGKQYMKDVVNQIEECKRKLSKEDRIELIFVNDDPQEAIPTGFFSELISVVVLQTDCNRGIHGARVRGLENSIGKYVLFLDQDDQIAPDYFLSQMQCIGDNDGVVCQVIHEKKRFYNNITPFHKIMNKEYLFRNGSPVISPGQVLLRRDSIPVLWKTCIIQNNGADDFFLWLCMLAEGRNFVLNEQILFEHVVKYHSASLNSYQMMCSEEEVVHVLLDHHVFSDEDNTQLEKMLQRIRKKTLDNLDKFRKMFYVLDDWSMSEEEGDMLENYLVNQEIHCLAVYGFGPLGKRFIRKLRYSKIQVKYIIDQNAAFLETEYPTCMLEDDLEEVDAVIITLVQSEKEIAKRIRERTSAKIFMIGEIIESIIKEAHLN
ncbi:MAG: glycosyltransferase family 2 protein [Lachnospiraceae bacterium]|nr:glycosyltransferase family 2 protein [Lachnospiraceae bacterium]